MPQELPGDLHHYFCQNTGRGNEMGWISRLLVPPLSPADSFARYHPVFNKSVEPEISPDPKAGQHKSLVNSLQNHLSELRELFETKLWNGQEGMSRGDSVQEMVSRFLHSKDVWESLAPWRGAAGTSILH